MSKFQDIIDSHIRERFTPAYIQGWYDDVYTTGKEPIPEKSNKALVPGKIYTFKYLSDHPDQPYDLKPIFLYLYGKVVNGDPLFYGINVSYIPPRHRMKVLGNFFDYYFNKGIDTTIKNLEKDKLPAKFVVNYYEVKKILENTGYQMALSVFRHRKIIGVPQIVTYADWWKLCFLTPRHIKNINLAELYKIYEMQRNSPEALAAAEKANT